MTIIAQRPEAGAARPYRFPAVIRRTVAGGQVVAAHLPGHRLAVATLLLDAGAGREPAGREGLAGVLAKALEEGTGSRDSAAYALALEGLGTELFVSADWDSFRVGVQVSADRLGAAVELLAEAVRTPGSTRPTSSGYATTRRPRCGCTGPTRAHGPTPRCGPTCSAPTSDTAGRWAATRTRWRR